MNDHLLAKILLYSLLVTLLSCRHDQDPINPYGQHTIVISTSDWETEDAIPTRSSLMVTPQGILSRWIAGDKVSIFLQDGMIIPAYLSDTLPHTTALIPEDSLPANPFEFRSACYPPVDWQSTSHRSIAVRYSGQKQMGRSSIAHLGQYDYQVAKARFKQTNTFLDFQHVGSLLALDLILPVSDEVTHVMLNASEDLFVLEGTVRLDGDQFSILPVHRSHQLLVKTEGLGIVQANDSLRIYVMTAPADFTDHTVEVWVNGHVGYLHLGQLEAGKAYYRSVSLSKLAHPFVPWVDLGLSVYWADHNIGATAPEHYGRYFSWGSVDIQQNFSQSDSHTYGSSGPWDSGCSGLANHDAAMHYWGGKARTPSLEELEELTEQCTWDWCTRHGIRGACVFGPNGNSIFLPAAGYSKDDFVAETDERCYYWSASPMTRGNFYAYFLHADSAEMYSRWDYRYIGFPIRPVCLK